MDHLGNLIPQNKADLVRAQAAVDAGYPEVAPILGELVVWLQDYNWPVAHILGPFLASLGPPVVPHIWHVLRSNDDVWKYWVIDILIGGLSKTDAAEFRSELERLCYSPDPREALEELNEQARNVLEQFGWLRDDRAPSL